MWKLCNDIARHLRGRSIIFTCLFFLGAVGMIVTGCGSDSDSDSDSDSEECSVDPTYNPSIDPANFVAVINNPRLPLVPGTQYVYKGGGETIEVTVTNDTKKILGVTATVVRDVASEDGEIVEDTFDWFAQDTSGNVWYLGEDTKEFENGKVVSTAGSWEAGVGGAKPGIVMHESQPPIGTPYRQEYAPCEAEDMAEVVDLSVSVTVPYGSFDNCLQTREFTPLEPDANEYKFYCPGIGLVLEIDINTGQRVELVEINTL